MCLLAVQESFSEDNNQINEDFSTMSASQLNEWEQMNKEHGGNWKYGSRVRYRDPGSGGY